MTTTNRTWLYALAASFALAGCAAAEQSAEAVAKSADASAGAVPAAEDPARSDTIAKTSGQEYRGWYMEHAGKGMLHACGQSQQWNVDSPALRSQAKEFGLDEDTPVYVRVFATQSTDGGELVVARVEQFGSPTPVRDCAMTGVVTSSPTGG